MSSDIFSTDVSDSSRAASHDSCMESDTMISPANPHLFSLAEDKRCAGVLKVGHNGAGSSRALWHNVKCYAL